MHGIISKILFSVLVVYSFSSCTKEDFEVQTPVSQINSNQTVLKPNVNSKSKIVIFTCDLARKSHNCIDGFGICNFEWFPDAPWKQKMSGTINSETNEMTIFDPIFYDNGQDIFYVDEDISLPLELAKEFGFQKILVKAGQYQKNFNENQSVTLDVILD